eukprot:c16929_g1_i1 orf=237-2420(-)
MPPLCAENNNLLACMASSARQEASLVAIAQQLMQHQHQHKPAYTLHPHTPYHTSSSSSQHQASMDHWASSCWQQAKTEDFANTFYSDAISDFLPFTPADIPTASDLMLPSLDSHIPDSDFPMQKDFSLSKPNEEALLGIDTSELSQTLTSVDGVGELVDGLLQNTSTGQPSVDVPPEWFDCLMYDTDEGAMASCFEPNPCESTQSSEPASSDYLPCTPLEEALPDAFALLEATNMCAPGWTREAGNEMASGASSRDLLGMSPYLSRDGLGMCATSHDILGICAGASTDVMSMHASLRDAMGMQVKRGITDERGGLHEMKKEGGKVASSSTTSGGERGRVQHRQGQVPAHGVQLMQLLLECAKAVENDHQKAAILIPQLKIQASRYGDPIQRLAAYFTEALCRRLARAQGRGEVSFLGGECSAQELTLAYKEMNVACPYFTFAQLTANQAILEAIDGAETVHIVDFGISQGVQWAAMLQAIAAREGRTPPNKITITGVASPELGEKRADSLAATGRRLSDFARNLNLNLEFRQAPVALDDATLSTHMFHIKTGEVVIVNFMLELCNLLDGAAEEAVARTLRVAAQLCPRVATVAEMDAHLNTGPFQKRFVSALHFFSAMFDSLEAGMSRDSVHRLCMERWLLGERIHTMVGGHDDGPRRRLQAHAGWCAALQAANFRPCPLSHYAFSQARILLWNFCDSFTLNEQQGSLSLGWQNKPLLTVSAWTMNA